MKKKLSQTKHNQTGVFHFPHAAPIPYTLTASLVKASANKFFLIFNYSQYIAGSLLNTRLPAVL